MAFEPEKIDFSQINGGKEYVDEDIVSEVDINKLFKSGAYVQKFAEVFVASIDTTEIYGTGTPQITLVEKVVDGQVYKTLKFKNLKGITGDSGIVDAGLSNEFGDSDKNGYTQSFINSAIENPNLLINGNFKINQRGKPYYLLSGYTVDRWKQSGKFNVTPVDNGINLQNTTNETADIVQYVEKSRDLDGQYVTLSLSIDNVVYSKTYMLSVNMLEENISISGFGEARVGYNSNIDLYYVGIYDTPAQNPYKDVHTVNFAKLEVGKIATKFVPPNYLEELQKCQHYYQNFSFETVAITTSSSVIMQITIPLLVSMRSEHTITSITGGYVSVGAWKGSEWIDLTIASSKIYDNCIRLNFISNSDLGIGNVYKLQSLGELAIDGDI